MTVEELIKELSKYPSNWKIYYMDELKEYIAQVILIQSVTQAKRIILS